jgi:hypothetical protein
MGRSGELVGRTVWFDQIELEKPVQHHSPIHDWKINLLDLGRVKLPPTSRRPSWEAASGSAAKFRIQFIIRSKEKVETAYLVIGKRSSETGATYDVRLSQEEILREVVSRAATKVPGDIHAALLCLNIGIFVGTIGRCTIVAIAFGFGALAAVQLACFCSRLALSKER